MTGVDREEEYLVFVDDNFFPLEQRRRFYRGAFRTERSAIEASQQIVDAALAGLRRANPTECDTPEDLLHAFRTLGPDPFVIAPDGAARSKFSAIEYAARRCTEIYSEQKGRTRKHRRASVLSRGHKDFFQYIRALCGRGSLVFGAAVKRH